MLERFRRWLRDATPRAVPAPAAVSQVEWRERNALPVVDPAERRRAEDWPGIGEAYAAMAPRLSGCRSWVCQLQGVNWERIEASISDLVVVDISPDGMDGSAFSAGHVERMRSKPGGGSTAVLAYLSVGAAEPWRSYWSPKWRHARPGWMDETQGSWTGSRLVHYWDKRWQSLLYEQTGSRLEQIVTSGYDGVVLGEVGAYAHWRSRGRQSAPDEMIELVARIGQNAWKANPDFLVVPMGGEELLGSPRYRSAVSAVITEQLLYRLVTIEGALQLVENEPNIIAQRRADLQVALSDGIPVLGLEYLCDLADAEAYITSSTSRLRSMAIIPHFAPRNLDRLCAATRLL